MNSTDFLIIGSGIAGLSYALKVAELGKVIIVTKKARVDSATNLAQGGIAAVLDKHDSFQKHIQDTLTSGAGICNESIVKQVVEAGPDRIQDLLELGINFNRSEQGLDLGKEGGHSARRIAHALDATGREIERGLISQAENHANITILENHLAVDLLIASRAGLEVSGPHLDRCLGAYIMERGANKITPLQARVTLLCTGGVGKVYLYTTNPDIATGDGIAMAYRAGAKVANLEFVQFHPTCLFHPKTKNFLISEAVRGEGGILKDEQGQPFMAKYDSRGDLATRDTVARAIDTEMKASGDDSVFLDISHRSPEFIKQRFPNIYQTCLSLGIDITKEPIPVVPAAHYMCGGVLTDNKGRTNITNLYALGETACTGLHGGNRLASNSLLEAVVFAHEAANQCHQEWPQLAKIKEVVVPNWAVGQAEKLDQCILVTHYWDQLRRLMWNFVGIVRSEQRLNLVRKQLAPLNQDVSDLFHEYLLTPDLVELRNLSLVAELIIKCALQRKESRGLHYTIDYPNKDDLLFQRNTVL